jgi:hypothetical protein
MAARLTKKNEPEDTAPQSPSQGKGGQEGTTSSGRREGVGRL